MYIKNNGNYKKVVNAFLKKEGTYVPVLKAYVKENGVYKTVVSLSDINLLKYSVKQVKALVQAGTTPKIPIEIYNNDNNVLVEWHATVESGDFEIEVDSDDYNFANIITKNQSSVGVIYAIVDGVNLGEVPVTIKYSGGL